MTKRTAMTMLFDRCRRKVMRTDFARDTRGVAAVEFGLMSTVVFTLMAGAIDVTNALVIQRDINRFAVEMTQSIASCTSSSCALTMIRAIDDRKTNIMLGMTGSSLTVGMATIKRRSGKIDTTQGTMTYLPADINTRALLVLKDECDEGAVTLITYKSTPFLLGFTSSWGQNATDFRAFNVVLAFKPGGTCV